ncbi:TVP38/TMEM64 family protein [Paenibacillus sp. FA6]|uniref:TVP38/TMEM64 family protein n=1 Tax=Paenibacillus sp. FA6 TaxID=3413029 RepID=UPI003F65C43D
MIAAIDIMSMLTEENMKELLERYREFGPLPGILLTFMKSFIPPLPTLIIVGVNAAVYGLWLGFLYSWIGLVSGCLVTFLVVRRVSSLPYFQKWAQKPKVAKSMIWIQRNAFSYVFLLGIFPVGPFVVVNIVAGVARMRIWSYLIAVTLGKGIMVFYVSYIGHDLQSFVEHPIQLVYVLLFIAISFVIIKKIEGYFTRTSVGLK